MSALTQVLLCRFSFFHLTCMFFTFFVDTFTISHLFNFVNNFC
uniref:Uncharacterized protein n=1 Tax=Myoviridae sp. ctAys2 TaxID=2825044 RepID=A0A8S5Q5Q7_9CAUD|nr:MAG TPA: hypothetical protein [Myoviridae sp. ctAys2]